MTLKQLKLILLAVLAASATSQALADSHPLVERRFKAADANHDGHLTKNEAQAGMPKVATVFDQIDTDKKGYITLKQLEAYVEMHQQDQ
ncbi:MULTISPECIES: hypothetical protein [unclassified Paludibacterium]|uniref:hypothetical protein n=1 Tax=unclassified Paludibacterium TaxID=2618429 RepID=UPI001C04E3FA|nr:hypothetical protein [Paludibacterium sp. B53371]BEV71120.1 hypothetical protein THUN1379_06020 [Paludibacterium sp. THUN1379]